MAGKPLPAGKDLACNLSVRMTQRDTDHIYQYCNSIGISFSDWVRSQVQTTKKKKKP